MYSVSKSFTALAIGLLVEDGVLSLEDRIVKDTFRSLSTGCTCPPEFPVCVCGHEPKVDVLTRKPIVSTQEELNENPRARSAKLRVAEKL